MPFYEYEITIEELIDILKQKRDAESGKSSGTENAMPDVGKYMNGAKNMASSFKMPKIPKF